MCALRALSSRCTRKGQRFLFVDGEDGAWQSEALKPDQPENEVTMKNEGTGIIIQREGTDIAEGIGGAIQCEGIGVADGIGGA